MASSWTIVEAVPKNNNLFLYVLITGLVLFALILICRQAFNWYIKHNAMLSQLESVRSESQKTNAILESIENELRVFRQEMRNHRKVPMPVKRSSQMQKQHSN